MLAKAYWKIQALLDDCMKIVLILTTGSVGEA